MCTLDRSDCDTDAMVISCELREVDWFVGAQNDRAAREFDGHHGDAGRKSDLRCACGRAGRADGKRRALWCIDRYDVVAHARPSPRDELFGVRQIEPGVPVTSVFALAVI